MFSECTRIIDEEIMLPVLNTSLLQSVVLHYFVQYYTTTKQSAPLFSSVALTSYS